MKGINTAFNCNNVEYSFDVRDAEHAERFQGAIDKMRKEAAALPESNKAGEVIRSQCGVIKKFFDNVFGDGAGSAVCTERDNLGVCIEAYQSFMDLVREQNEWLSQARAAIPGKK